jgi:hypothetical protein
VAQVSFFLSDTQEIIRSRAERAFEHLQRSIVADADVRKKWQDAFKNKNGEATCEALGAVHLLLHGIWAFKANSAGERTDLIYRDVLSDADRVRRAADGLVLTEWKKPRDGENSEALYKKAFTQARLYSQGSLADIELAAYRYLVLVSMKRIIVPANLNCDGITYRYINIAVAPDSPSQDGLRLNRRGLRKDSG